jgi:hypothetical protein
VNRRSFLKSLLLGLAALVPPERDNMQIGDILKKMGASTLTHAEQEALRLWGNELQQGGSLIAGMQNGTANINVNTVRAKQGEFGFVPTEAIYVGTGTIALTSGVETQVTFSTTTQRKSYFFYYNPSDATKIFVSRPTWHLALAYGTISFAAQAGGTRKMQSYTYDATGAQVGTGTVLNVLPTGATDVYPVIFNLGISDSVAYLKFTVTQDSGSAVNLLNSNLTFAVMR